MTPDDAGGTRHFEVARYLIERGHEVTAIAGDVNYLSGKKDKDLPEVSIYSGIKVIRIKTSAQLHTSFISRLLSFIIFMVKSLLVAIRVKNIDLVFGTSPPIFQGLTSYIVSRLKRVPFILEIRDLWPDFMVQVGAINNPLFIYPARWLEGFLYKKAELIIINSPGFYPHLLGKGIKRKKIKLIPNGVDTSMFDPEDKGESVKQEFNIEGRFIVLYAGAMGRSNDIGTLLEAFRLLKENGEIILLLVGGGNEKEKLEFKVRNEGIDNVIFVPPVQKSRIPEFIATSDVGVAILKDISMFRTTYPNKVFDYMAGGRPVLLAIDGAIRDVVEKAKAGIFAQPGDPEAIANGIMKLYKNDEQRKEMGIKGREYVVRNFERKNQSIELEKILLEVL